MNHLFLLCLLTSSFSIVICTSNDKQTGVIVGNEPPQPVHSYLSYINNVYMVAFGLGLVFCLFKCLIILWAVIVKEPDHNSNWGVIEDLPLSEMPKDNSVDNSVGDDGDGDSESLSLFDDDVSNTNTRSSKTKSNQEIDLKLQGSKISEKEKKNIFNKDQDQRPKRNSEAEEGSGLLIEEAELSTNKPETIPKRMLSIKKETEIIKDKDKKTDKAHQIQATENSDTSFVSSQEKKETPHKKHPKFATDTVYFDANYGFYRFIYHPVIGFYKYTRNGYQIFIHGAVYDNQKHQIETEYRWTWPHDFITYTIPMKELSTTSQEFTRGVDFSTFKLMFDEDTCMWFKIFTREKESKLKSFVMYQDGTLDSATKGPETITIERGLCEFRLPLIKDTNGDLCEVFDKLRLDEVRPKGKQSSLDLFKLPFSHHKYQEPSYGSCHLFYEDLQQYWYKRTTTGHLLTMKGYVYDTDGRLIKEGHTWRWPESFVTKRKGDGSQLVNIIFDTKKKGPWYKVYDDGSMSIAVIIYDDNYTGRRHFS